MEGFSISAVRIAGVDHEFSTIRGVVEDVVEIILNLKQIRIKQLIADEDVSTEKIYLTVSGKEELRAGDIEEHTNVFKVMNPEQIISEKRSIVKHQLRLRDLGKSREQKFKKIDEQLTLGIMNQVNTSIHDYCKKHSYLLVMGNEIPGNVLYGDEAINITEQVLKKLNKDYLGE